MASIQTSRGTIHARNAAEAQQLLDAGAITQEEFDQLIVAVRGDNTGNDVDPGDRVGQVGDEQPGLDGDRRIGGAGVNIQQPLEGGNQFSAVDRGRNTQLGAFEHRGSNKLYDIFDLATLRAMVEAFTSAEIQANVNTGNISQRVADAVEALRAGQDPRAAFDGKDSSSGGDGAGDGAGDGDDGGGGGDGGDDLDRFKNIDPRIENLQIARSVFGDDLRGQGERAGLRAVRAFRGFAPIVNNLQSLLAGEEVDPSTGGLTNAFREFTGPGRLGFQDIGDILGKGLARFDFRQQGLDPGEFSGFGSQFENLFTNEGVDSAFGTLAPAFRAAIQSRMAQLAPNRQAGFQNFAFRNFQRRFSQNPENFQSAADVFRDFQRRGFFGEFKSQVQ